MADRKLPFGSGNKTSDPAQFISIPLSSCLLEPAHTGQLLNFQKFCELVVNPLLDPWPETCRAQEDLWSSPFSDYLLFSGKHG